MTSVSLTEAWANLSTLVELAASTHERFEVTRTVDRVAVLLGANDYDGLWESARVEPTPETGPWCGQSRPPSS